jgi:hypothetical protein
MRRTSGIQEMIDAKRREIAATEALLQGQRIELEELKTMRRRTNNDPSRRAPARRSAERRAPAPAHRASFALDQGRARKAP